MLKPKVQQMFEGFIPSLSRLKTGYLPQLIADYISQGNFPGEGSHFNLGFHLTHDIVSLEAIQGLPQQATGLTLRIGGTETIFAKVMKDRDEFSIERTPVSTPQGNEEQLMPIEDYLDQVAASLSNQLLPVVDDGQSLFIACCITGPQDNQGRSTAFPNLLVDFQRRAIHVPYELGRRIGNKLAERKTGAIVQFRGLNDLCALIFAQAACPDKTRLTGEAIGVVNGSGYGVAIAVLGKRLKELYPNNPYVRKLDDDTVCIINPEVGHYAEEFGQEHLFNSLVRCGCKNGETEKHTEVKVSGRNINRLVPQIINQLEKAGLINSRFAQLVKNKVYPGERNDVKGISTKQLVEFLPGRSISPKKVAELFREEIDNETLTTFRYLIGQVVERAAMIAAASVAASYQVFFSEKQVPIILEGGLFACPEFKRIFTDTLLVLTDNSQLKDWFMAGNKGDMQDIGLAVISMIEQKIRS